MLVLTAPDNRLVPAQLNVITLKTKSGSYVYADRVTYDYAVILNAKYRDAISDLKTLIGEMKNNEAINRFYDEMPEPLNILAPFLSIINHDGLNEEDFEVLVGCMHVLSTTLDFTKYIKLPAEVRRSVVFSDHVRVEYTPAWEHFINECVSYEKLHQVFAANGTFSANVVAYAPAATATVPSAPAPAPTTPAPAPVAEKTISPEAEAIETDTTEFDKCESEEDIRAFLDGLMNASMAAAGATEDTAKLSSTSSNDDVSIPEAKSGKGLLDDWDL